MEIGLKVKKIREIRNYSQEYMAEMLGISQVAYSRLETGKTRMDLNRMQDIAHVLEVDPIVLLTFDDSIVFNHCNQSGKSVNNYNGLTAEKEAHFESRIEYLEKMIQKLVERLDDEKIN